MSLGVRIPRQRSNGPPLMAVPRSPHWHSWVPRRPQAACLPLACKAFPQEGVASVHQAAWWCSACCGTKSSYLRREASTGTEVALVTIPHHSQATLSGTRCTALGLHGAALLIWDWCRSSDFKSAVGLGVVQAGVLAQGAGGPGFHPQR